MITAFEFRTRAAEASLEPLKARYGSMSSNEELEKYLFISIKNCGQQG